MLRISRPQRVPHRFGEPATVGVVDQMPRRIAHLMIQSIAHVSRIFLGHARGALMERDGEGRAMWKGRKMSKIVRIAAWA